MNRFRFLADRTAVLFLGVAAGTAIGYAFGTGNETRQAVALAPEAAPVQGAPASEAPPPPAGPVAPGDADAAQEREVLANAAASAAAVPPPQASPAPVARTEAGIVGDQPAPLARGEGHGIRVGVFGDSFGDGVWSALYRLLPGSAGFQVTKYSQQSTGFTRYKRLNLESHDAERLGDQPLDVAVISFGANDAQGVCDAGHCGALMSPYWQQVIGGRVESYVAMLRRHNAAIYWVGLPAMRDRGFDADAQAMNSFYRGLMGRLGVPFVDIRGLTTDAAGQYEAYYSDEGGGQKLLRAGDGIHMSMNGYVRITKALASRIRERAGAAQPAPKAAAPKPADPAAADPDPAR